jgi:hypothetical protein
MMGVQCFIFNSLEKLAIGMLLKELCGKMVEAACTVLLTRQSQQDLVVERDILIIGEGRYEKFGLSRASSRSGFPGLDKLRFDNTCAHSSSSTF